MTLTLCPSSRTQQPEHLGATSILFKGNLSATCFLEYPMVTHTLDPSSLRTNRAMENHHRSIQKSAFEEKMRQNSGQLTIYRFGVFFLFRMWDLPESNFTSPGFFFFQISTRRPEWKGKASHLARMLQLQNRLQQKRFFIARN